MKCPRCKHANPLQAKFCLECARSACARSSPTATSASASSTGLRKREQAQEHLATATTMHREMGMTYWLGQAETEAGQSN